METILFLGHTEADGSLAKPALEALETARKLVAALPGSSLVAGLLGAKVDGAASQIAAAGAARCLAAVFAELEQPRYGTDAAAAETLCREAKASLVIAAGTPRWARVLPGLAQRLNGRVDTHVTGAAVEENRVVATRWYYRQRLEASLVRTQRPWIILTDPGSQPAYEGQPGTVNPEFVSVTFPDGLKRTTVLGKKQLAGDARTIRPEAKLLLVAGAGWTKKQADGKDHIKEAEKLLMDCLQLTGASLGSSKSLVDLGGEGQQVLSFLTHMNQIGQTGSTPRHPKGLATCCHGEEPHTVGWRFIHDRRAVNLNPACGWALNKADVLYVADAFEVIRKLNELLSR